MRSLKVFGKKSQEYTGNHMSQESKPSFYAVIPANVRYCSNIEMGAKLLYAEITSLTHVEGYCWASNEYFSNLYEVETRTIQRWISSLVKENFITLEMIKEGFKTKRKIWIFIDNSNNVYGMTKMSCSSTTKMSPSTRQKCRTNNKPINTSSLRSEEKEYKEDPKSPKATPEVSAEADSLFNFFLQKMKERKKDFKTPNVDKWKSCMDLLLRLDKRDPDEAKKIIEWASTHKWWKIGCTSPESLRKNYDDMQMQMEAEKDKDRVRINRNFALYTKNQHPKQLSGLTFDDKFVTNAKTCKEIPFDMATEAFERAFLSLFGGEYV